MRSHRTLLPSLYRRTLTGAHRNAAPLGFARRESLLSEGSWDLNAMVKGVHQRG